jgi:putative tryptophan/tyrosine transport system substrate-binding protein
VSARGTSTAAGKIYKIGIFGAGGGGSATMQGVIPAALRELGWIEGRNIVFERCHADNQLDQLPILAAELVSLNVDVIVAAGTLTPLGKASDSNNTYRDVIGG